MFSGVTNNATRQVFCPFDELLYNKCRCVTEHVFAFIHPDFKRNDMSCESEHITFKMFPTK